MEEKLKKLHEIMSEIVDIQNSIALLGWDQQVYMPEGAAENHGYMIGTLGKIAHEKFSAREVGNLLEELSKYLPDLDPDSEEYRIIKVTAKDFEKTTCVPADYIFDKAQVTSQAHQAWMKAREKSDFTVFQESLKKIIELQNRYISFFPPTEHPYDVLLDDYEPGLKTSEVKAIFSELRPQQVELIRAIGQKDHIPDEFLHQKFDENKMWEFSRKIASAFGYDWRRGRQDKTEHPFCSGMGPDDVRITSRWMPDNPLALLFGTMHETGHALYDQGVGRIWSRTALDGGTSLAIHESQSRLWENIVGRSHAFWEFFYPEFQQTFPDQLGSVSVDRFYRAINKVKPSFIRLEADEATYNLHIMLRLELEISMIEGRLDLQNLPEIWNQEMEEYLGVTPPHAAAGVLQDIHWSIGLFGYFSTYALGNLVSAQLWEKFNAVNPDLDEQIRRGDFSALLSWLRVKIHQHGRKYEPQELIHRVTRSRIDYKPYIQYLQKKYGEVYELDTAGPVNVL